MHSQGGASAELRLPLTPSIRKANNYPALERRERKGKKRNRWSANDRRETGIALDCSWATVVWTQGAWKRRYFGRRPEQACGMERGLCQAGTC